MGILARREFLNPFGVSHRSNVESSSYAVGRCDEGHAPRVSSGVSGDSESGVFPLQCNTIGALKACTSESKKILVAWLPHGPRRNKRMPICASLFSTMTPPAVDDQLDTNTAQESQRRSRPGSTKSEVEIGTSGIGILVPWPWVQL